MRIESIIVEVIRDLNNKFLNHISKILESIIDSLCEYNEVFFLNLNRDWQIHVYQFLFQI